MVKINRINILIIGNRLLGDSLDSFPALHLLFRYLPQLLGSGIKINFDLLTYRYSQVIYQKTFDFKKVFLIDDQKNYLCKKNVFFKKTLHLLPLLKNLHKQYQGVYILPGGFGWGVFARLIHPQWIVGHNHDYRGFLLTHPVTYSYSCPNYNNFLCLSKKVISIYRPTTISHNQEEVDSITKKFIPEIKKSLHKLIPTEATSKWKEKVLSHLKIRTKAFPSQYVVIAPTASEEIKSWKGENFFYLAQKLSRKKYKIFWVGINKEYKKIENVCQHGKFKIGYNLAGILELKEVFTLIKQSSGFVGNDSGLAHAASMLGVPTVIIYGPSNPTLTQPLNGALHHNQKSPEKLCLVYQEHSKIPHEKRKKKSYQEILNINHITVEQAWGKMKSFFP